jgi:hypothetical protein
VVNFSDFLEESWYIVIFISVFFVFYIIYQDLRDQTQNPQSWQRASSTKFIPRIRLTFQHYNRRVELLSENTIFMCYMVRDNMLRLLSVNKGLTKEETENLLENKERLETYIDDPTVVRFILDPKEWVSGIIPEQTYWSKITKWLKRLFEKEERKEELIYIELALVVNRFRKMIATLI